MSGEAVAKVCRDLADGRFDTNPTINDRLPKGKSISTGPIGHASKHPIIDATPMFHQLKGEPIDLYQDFTLMPVWDNANVVYVNSFGNVRAALVAFMYPDDDAWEEWGSDNPIDWPNVAWVAHMIAYTGGRSQGQPRRTSGPWYAWQIACNADGELLDIHWTNMLPGELVHDEELIEALDQLCWVTLQTYTLAGCVNVELSEPARPKPERKRIARTGQTVQQLVVRPTSKSSRSTGSQVIGGGPCSLVRGHFAKYGIEGRAKLFGKYTGKYWVPAHVRGGTDPDHQARYRIETIHPDPKEPTP